MYQDAEIITLCKMSSPRTFV